MEKRVTCGRNLCIQELLDEVTAEEDYWEDLCSTKPNVEELKF